MLEMLLCSSIISAQGGYTMDGRKMAVWGMTLACGLTIGSEAFALGKGDLDQLRLKDGSCLTTTSVPLASQTLTTTTTPTQDRLKDGSCLTAPDRDRLQLKDGTGSVNVDGYGADDVLPDSGETLF